MDDRGPRSGYGRGSRPADPEYQRPSWTPFQGGPSSGPGFRGARAYSPEPNTQPVDMDLDERDSGYHGGPSMASKRLTAHVAPVPGRSMSPDTTRVDPRFGGGGGRRIEDEEDFLYGNAPAIKKEPRPFPEERKFPEDRKFPTSSRPPYDDYDRRRGSFDSRQPFPSESDPYESKPQIRRPPSPGYSGYRGGDPRPGIRVDGSGEYNDIDAGRRAPRPAVQLENKNFGRDMYPARGESKPNQQGPRVAVYEMNKIPKKARDEDSHEGEETRLMKLRSEHAKIELRANQLKQLVDRTVEKENELKRLNKGRALADNKEFCDNKKLQIDAQKKYEDSLKQQRELEVELNAILNAQAKRMAALNDTGDNSQDGEAVPQPKQNVMFSTDYLDEQREDREEELDTAAKLEFFDGGDHWCEPCQDYFVDSVKSYLDHLHSDDHWKNIPSNKQAPWPITRRTRNYDEDRQMAALKGTQFMVPCKAYYCAICKVFSGDKEAAEEHLFSITHNKIIARFFISKPECEHIYNKDKNTARAKAAANNRAKKREMEEKKRREEEENRKRIEEENKRKEKEIKDKIMQESKYMKILNEKTKAMDKMKNKDVSREKVDRKRGRNVSSSSSSSSSRESSPEIEEIKPNPLDDIKLKKKCIIAIPKEEFIRAKKAYGKLTLALSAEASAATSSTSDDSKPKEISPPDSRDDTKDVPNLSVDNDNSKSHCSTPSTKDEEDGASYPKKSKVSADFDDDEDDQSNFNLSSVMPSEALEPDDNAVTSPDSATKSDQVVSSSETKPSKESSPSKKPVVTNFDAICNALEDDDEDSAENKSATATGKSSPVKGSGSPSKILADNVVRPKPAEPMETGSGDADSSKPTEEYVSSGHSFPQLSLDDLTKSPSYDDV